MPNEPKQKPAENNTAVAALRHHARRYALQAMYQWQIADAAIMDIENEFLLYQTSEKKFDLEYFKELLHGVPAHLDEIDAEIKPSLGRAFQEIDPIELAMLRIATYELLKRPDVPYRVIINEALVLTKKFGSSDGHKFVNGILDRIARKIRATEIGMAKK